MEICCIIEEKPGESIMSYERWVSVWGNAVSVAENRPERYAKNITIRYPIHIPFSGRGVRLTFDNYCGTEPIILSKVTVFYGGEFYRVTWEGRGEIVVEAGERVVTDPVEVALNAFEMLHVSFYLADYTLMRSVVYASGPLSEGLYANGDETENPHIDIMTSRRTHLFYFLSNVSILTDEENRAIVCYGDSITAQDWPDYLALRCFQEGYHNTAVIRRAASGTRILREYDCIQYESYGLKGEHRFGHEVPTDGADTVIIQQGINDIIHPVGEENNVFRPMTDLPTAEELFEGLKYYIDQARGFGYKVYVGTLLPMGGWRTDAPFRQEIRHRYNELIRNSNLIDGVIDFDKVLQDPENPDAMLPEYDSGDHLHPGKTGYAKMAASVPEELLK